MKDFIIRLGLCLILVGQVVFVCVYFTQQIAFVQAQVTLQDDNQKIVTKRLIDLEEQVKRLNDLDERLKRLEKPKPEIKWAQ